MATAPHWLRMLLDRFDARTAAVGVRGQLCYDKSAQILHSLGCLWNYRILCEINASLMPNFPSYDVGEEAIVQAQRAGWKTIALPNTFSDPALLPSVKDPYRTIYADRTLDPEGDVIFMHLGRGISKSVTGVVPAGKTSPEQWLSFAEDLLRWRQR